MSTAKQVGEAVKHLAKHYKAVIDMGEFLEGIGDLDAQVVEMQKAVIKAQYDKDAALMAKGIAENGMAAAKKALEDVKVAAVQAEKDVKEALNKLIAGAKAEALEIVNYAEGRKQALLNQIEEQTTEHNVWMTDAKHEEDVLRGRIADLKREMEALKARLS